MTKASRPLTRETEATIRSTGKRYPIIVSLNHGGMVLSFRLKKHRQSYALPVDWCFWRAVEAHLRAERNRKEAERRMKRVH